MYVKTALTIALEKKKLYCIQATLILQKYN